MVDHSPHDVTAKIISNKNVASQFLPRRELTENAHEVIPTRLCKEESIAVHPGSPVPSHAEDLPTFVFLPQPVCSRHTASSRSCRVCIPLVPVTASSRKSARATTQTITSAANRDPAAHQASDHRRRPVYCYTTTPTVTRAKNGYYGCRPSLFSRPMYPLTMVLG